MLSAPALITSKPLAVSKRIPDGGLVLGRLFTLCVRSAISDSGELMFSSPATKPGIRVNTGLKLIAPVKIGPLKSTGKSVLGLIVSKAGAVLNSPNRKSSFRLGPPLSKAMESGVVKSKTTSKVSQKKASV